MVVHQWQHLKMLKRAERGHDPAGIEATKAGECVVECPACLHPGINLEDGWETESEETRWANRKIITIDACFCLKLKECGFKDPELGSGWVYFVMEDAYQDYLRTCKDQREITTCESELNAVKQAYSKGTNSGLSVTGVVGVKCACHCFVLPNSIGDLQKGERYCNVDYTILSALKVSRKTQEQKAVPDLDFSYNIACNW
ncbi:hypothetical protein SCP_1302910 [Sparassis crispa]|uniref:CxC2-like cysteine cluster KDZ transposase-associated domain-containing protein n=1 Tax=Sparassis crispa TaxID=139825 RepID=A0A401H219_9APHY|nr:hypothetical protein SCP_1302910 [Sparassis crispa]GBE88475.1 hypothetical protein SCP_1302910 [Sparassis crispa]